MLHLSRFLYFSRFLSSPRQNPLSKQPFCSGHGRSGYGRSGQSRSAQSRSEQSRSAQNSSGLGLLLCLCLGLTAGCDSESSNNKSTPETSASIESSPQDSQPEKTPSPSARPAPPQDPERTIRIDGSSTVFPITEAVSALFEQQAPSIPMRLGVSGTGGGFQKFCRRDIEIANASRPITDKEKSLCAENNVPWIEIPVAFDGISVVVHGDNRWSECMTVGELASLWSPEAQDRPSSWRDLRADWPESSIDLFGPGTDSGTFDYFTLAILGEEGRSRTDFSASEDDYLIAQGIADAPGGLGFFGFAYYREYQDRLRPVAVDAGQGCVSPSEETIADGRYRPLSRPLFLYLRADALERAEVADFVGTYLEQAPTLVAQVGYVPLPARAYSLAAARVQELKLGSVFDGGSQIGVSIEKLLELEAGQ